MVMSFVFVHIIIVATFKALKYFINESCNLVTDRELRQIFSFYFLIVGYFCMFCTEFTLFAVNIIHFEACALAITMLTNSSVREFMQPWWRSVS